MKKLISAIPFLCFFGILVLTAIDKKRYSTSTFVIIAGLLVLSIGSIIYKYLKITDESEKKKFNTRLLVMGIAMVLSIIISLYSYFQVN